MKITVLLKHFLLQKRRIYDDIVLKPRDEQELELKENIAYDTHSVAMSS